MSALQQEAVDDIAGGGDKVWKEAAEKLKKIFPFGVWRKGKGQFCGRMENQDEQVDIRVGQPHFVRNLSPLHIRKRER